MMSPKKHRKFFFTLCTMVVIHLLYCLIGFISKYIILFVKIITSIEKKSLSKHKMEILKDKILVDTELKPGIVFRSILPILADYKLMELLLDEIEKLIHLNNIHFDYIAGQQSRGFFFIALCRRFKCGFIPITKTKYSSSDVGTDTYTKEYKSETEERLYINPNLFSAESRFLLIDDLIATGGTMKCAINLINSVGSRVVACFAPIRLYGDVLAYDEVMHPTYSLFNYIASDTENNLLNHIYPKTLNYVETPMVHESVTTFIYSIPTFSSQNLANELRTKTTRTGLVRWDKFPDGTFHVDIEDPSILENKDVHIVFDLTSDEYPLEIQISLMIVIQRKGIRSLTVHIPYFNVGTMERFVREGEIATAETTLKIITRNFEKSNSRIVFYDVHALVTGFLTDAKTCDFVYCSVIPNLKAMLPEKYIVVFPDDGAEKRFGPMFNGRSIVLSKKRIGTRRIMSVKSYNNFPKASMLLDTPVIIVDDLCQTGGTLIECIEYLKTLGYSDINCFVTHGVFPDRSWKKFIDIGLNRFYVTNTLEQQHDYEFGFTRVPIISQGETLIQTPLKRSKIYVGSHNNDKMQAAYNMFSKRGIDVEVIGLNVPSGVSEQPFGLEETYRGALNRIKYIIHQDPEDAEYLIAFENGIFIGMEGFVVDFCACIIFNVLTNSIYTCTYDFGDQFFRELIKYEEYDNVVISKTDRKLFCIIPDFDVLKSIEEDGSKLYIFPDGITIANLVEDYYGYSKDHWHEHFNSLALTRTELMSRINVI